MIRHFLRIRFVLASRDNQRYETGSTTVTTGQPYKNWPKIFNNDSTLTSAVLDQLLDHAETVIVEGGSYRMKD